MTAPLALNLRNLRSARGLSQLGLAVRAEVSLRLVGEVERGERVPRGPTLAKLAAALGVSAERLAGEKP